MEAHVKTVREILHSGDQYLVPFFQRQYSWTRTEWQNLLSDVESLIDGEDDARHFLGPLVFTTFRPVPGEVTPYQLIDGQQRLTTLSLALAALRDVARMGDLGDIADEIHEDYLIHRRRQGLQRFKVVPRLEDRVNYEAVIEGTAPGVLVGTGIVGCHSFFKRSWKARVGDLGTESLRPLMAALTGRLSLVAITVDGENPYEIFESLNWKGLPLDEADLIRNYLFMQIPPAEQAAFHTARWTPFEKQFAAIPGFERIPPTQFYRDYLMRDGRYCRNKTTYVEFKRQNQQRGLEPAEQLSELQRFATFELWLQRPDRCGCDYLRSRLSDIQRLDATTAHPLLLNLLDRHDQGHLRREELDECLRDLAGFIIRRTICGESTRGYGRWFPEAIPTIGLNPAANLRRYWLEKGWPDDATFVECLADFPIYQREKRKCRLLLERLERGMGHREPVNLVNLPIEHVMPQTIDEGPVGQTWRTALGHEWEQEHAHWLHSLGNLTLTGYNQALGNGSFSAKKEVFAEGNLSLNSYFSGVEQWNGREIKQRAVLLGERLTRLWPRPGGHPLVPGPREEEPQEPAQPPGIHHHGGLHVVIHWSMLGVDLPDEPIQGASGAAAHSKLIGRLLAELSPHIKERLTQIPVARTSDNPETGYRLSATPERDFLNPNTGLPFGSRLVLGTQLYLFTNTDTPRKISDINRLARRLGLPAGSIQASRL